MAGMVRPLETLNAKTLLAEDIAELVDPNEHPSEYPPVGLKLMEGVELHVGAGPAQMQALRVLHNLKEAEPGQAVPGLVVDPDLAPHEWMPVYGG